MAEKENTNKLTSQIKELKKFPFITAGVSLVLMIVYCILPRGFGNVLNTFLFPALAISFILLGIYLIRNLQGKVKHIGIGAIVLGVLAYPLTSLIKMHAGGLLGVLFSIIKQFNPFVNGSPFGILTLLEFVTNGFEAGMMESSAALLPAALSLTFYAGILLYLFFPAGKVFKDNKEIAEKDSALRFYVCMFSAILAIFVIIALILWAVFALLAKAGDNGGSSSNTTVQEDGVERLVIVDGLNAICFEVRERGEIYNVRTSNEFVGYIRDARILDQKNNEIAFIGTNDEITFYDKNKQGKFAGFGALYVKVIVQ